MRISCTLFLFFTLSSVLSAQSFRESRTVWASAPAEVPAMARAVDVMLNSGHLVYERYQVDGSFQGRHHERMNQYHSGIRVFGGQLVWQKQSGGDVLRFLSKKNDVWFPKLKPVPVMGTEKENHTSWERYYRVSDCSSSSRNNWYLGR